MQRLVLIAMLGAGLFAGQSASADTPAKSDEGKKVKAEVARLQAQVKSLQAQLKTTAAVDHPRRPPPGDRGMGPRKSDRRDDTAGRDEADKRRDRPRDRKASTEGRHDGPPTKNGPPAKDGPSWLRGPHGPPPQIQHLRAMVEKIVGPEKAKQLHEVFMKQMHELHENVVKIVGEEKARELHAAFARVWGAHRPGVPMGRPHGPHGPPPAAGPDRQASHGPHRDHGRRHHEPTVTATATPRTTSTATVGMITTMPTRAWTSTAMRTPSTAPWAIDLLTTNADITSTTMASCTPSMAPRTWRCTSRRPASWPRR